MSKLGSNQDALQQGILGRSSVWCHWEAEQSETRVKEVKKVKQVYYTL